MVTKIINKVRVAALHQESMNSIDGLEIGLHVAANLIKEKKWVAQPIPPWGGWLEDKYIDWIADSMAKRGQETCLGVALEGDPFPDAYESQATFEGLRELRQCLRPFMFTLFPEDRSFFVLCTALEYSVIAGPSTFVIDACGGSLEHARAEYLEHAEESSGRQGTRLFEILEYYDSLSKDHW